MKILFGINKGEFIMGRGFLTESIKEKSKELLGYEIDTIELRLMPYIQYTMMNNQKIDIGRIDWQERKMLSKWREAGYITGGASQMTMTKEFWDIINELLFLGYVDYE